MKTATKPEIDLWFDPPEMDEETKAQALRAALDEAWAEAGRGEGVLLTSSEETREFIRRIGSEVEREFAKREKMGSEVVFI